MPLPSMGHNIQSNMQIMFASLSKIMCVGLTLCETGMCHMYQHHCHHHRQQQSCLPVHNHSCQACQGLPQTQHLGHWSVMVYEPWTALEMG